MENKHKIIAQLKQYLLEVKSADNEQLDVLISKVKGFIFDNENLLSEYNNRINKFKQLEDDKTFKQKLETLYKSLEKSYEIDFDLKEFNLAENLSLNLINDFFYHRSQTGRDTKYYLSKEYGLINFISEILIDSLSDLGLKVKVSDILFNIQKSVEDTYSFYLLNKEDFLINLYRASDLWLLQYKLALLDVIRDFIRYLKMDIIQNPQGVIDASKDLHNKLSSQETIIYNLINEDSTIKTIATDKKINDQSKQYKTTTTHFKNIAKKLGYKKGALKAIKQYKRKITNSNL